MQGEIKRLTDLVNLEKGTVLVLQQTLQEAREGLGNASDSEPSTALAITGDLEVRPAPYPRRHVALKGTPVTGFMCSASSTSWHLVSVLQAQSCAECRMRVCGMRESAFPLWAS